MFLSELLRVRLPKLDRGYQEIQSPSGIHYEFNWETQQDEWCGFSRVNLIVISEAAADFYRISEKDRSKIWVHFEEDRERFDSPYTAIMSPSSHVLTGANYRNDIYLNRSREMAERAYPTRDMPDYDIKNNVIWFALRNPWEYPILVLGEEINHAAVRLKLKNRAEYKLATRKYALWLAANNILPRFNSDGTPVTRSESQNLLEVTAGREKLRFAAKVATQLGLPDRAEFYREIYQLSLQKRMVTAGHPGPILDQVFIPTGWRP